LMSRSVGGRPSLGDPRHRSDQWSDGLPVFVEKRADGSARPLRSDRGGKFRTGMILFDARAPRSDRRMGRACARGGTGMTTFLRTSVLLAIAVCAVAACGSRTPLPDEGLEVDAALTRACHTCADLQVACGA